MTSVVQIIQNRVKLYLYEFIKGGGKIMTTLLSTVFAQTNLNLGAGTSGAFSGLGTLTLGAIIGFAINAVLILAAILFFFMLILGGVRWIVSGGDKTNTEAARSQVTAAIIGLVIVFSAWIILTFVLSIFGIEGTDFDFQTVETFNSFE